MKKINKEISQEFLLTFIKAQKVKASKPNKKGNRNLLVFLNNQTAISLSENFIKAVFANKKPQ